MLWNNEDFEELSKENLLTGMAMHRENSRSYSSMLLNEAKRLLQQQRMARHTTSLKEKVITQRKVNKR